MQSTQENVGKQVLNGRVAVVIILLFTALASLLGCSRPSASVQSGMREKEPAVVTTMPGERYEGYWLCCGYRTSDSVVSFDDLTTDERTTFPFLVLELSNEGSGQVTSYTRGKNPSIVSMGKWDPTVSGVRFDGDGGEVLDFSEDGSQLILQGESLTALSQCVKKWNGKGLPASDAAYHFERRTFDSQLYVDDITFDGISLDVPSDVVYLYDGEGSDSEDEVIVRSYRAVGPTVTLFSVPTEARDTIELAGDSYYGHEDDFVEYGENVYSMYRYESDDMCSTLLQFVMGGRRYSIDFSYDKARDPVDYSDYAERLYTTIELVGADDADEAEEAMPAGAIPWQEAARHIGETVAVVGPVIGAEYASESDGQPTFIDIGAAYPDPGRVTMVVWGEDREAFPEPLESIYVGKTLCVTGEVYEYDGACDIRVTSPAQVQVL